MQQTSLSEMAHFSWHGIAGGRTAKRKAGTTFGCWGTVVEAAADGDLGNLALLQPPGGRQSTKMRQLNRRKLRFRIVNQRTALYCATAQGLLGASYLRGEGVPQDYVLANMWANLAAASLSGDQREIAVAIRDEAAKKLSAEQLGEAQRLARDWSPASSK
jgi:TPR repeat protein